MAITCSFSSIANLLIGVDGSSEVKVRTGDPVFPRKIIMKSSCFTEVDQYEVANQSM